MNISHSESQDFSDLLFNQYPKFYEKALVNRRISHKMVVKLIEKLKENSVFEITEIGISFEKRSIFQIKIGNGPTKVLLWSQMHGNESTATRAIFDIFNFFANYDPSFESNKAQILKNCTLYFVPMLNPDGAERFERRNAVCIDLNRDAIRLQSPEAILLKKLQNDYKPHFGFNLHDQSIRYAVGDTGRQTTMAFLATAYNEAREINEIRKRSMQLIVGMNNILQKYIPGKIARFSDEFEPRAFGDNIQKWGTTLILIESGGVINDPEKEVIRKLNFVAILASLSQISTKEYLKVDIENYNCIPENTKTLFDVLIRNASLKWENKKIKMDIGINKEDLPTKLSNKFTVKSKVEDIGDLSTFYGIEELDAEGLEIIAEKPLNLNQKANFSLMKNNCIVYIIKNGSIIKQ